jgi:C1A family cysteine protease
MNNIEIKKIKGLKPGMTDKQINDLKKGKVVVEHKPKVEPKVEVEKEKLPSIQITKEDIKNEFKLDLKKDEKDDRDFRMSSMFYSLPNKIDRTSEMSRVKNQGRLGSCVGFATAAMKEWQEQQEHLKEVAAGKKYTREEDEYDLSEAWIYWKCKTIDPWPNEEGTSIRCAMQVLHKIGVPCEEAYPYNDAYKGEPESWAKLIAKWGLIDSYYRCNDLSALKSSLAKNGPTVIGVACFREIFYVGSNGYIPYPANSNEIYGGHAICAVGYDDSTQCVKFKNSWGTGWGNKGYGLLPYKYINDFLWDGWIAKDLSVTKKILKERAKDEL